MNSMYDKNEDSVLFSLDISAYYYSVGFDFDSFYNGFSEIKNINKFRNLSNIIEKVYKKYTKIISAYRHDFNKDKLILPIGLISSAILGNYCLKEFDNIIVNEIRPIYYSRYVDDILILFTKNKSVVEDDVFSCVHKYMPNIFREENNKIYFAQYDNLYIQNNKIKIIKTNSKGSKAELKLLLEQISNTSEINLIPNRNLDLENFYESIYEHQSDNLKIRDVNSINIDKYSLMNFISSFLLLKRNTKQRYQDSFYKMKSVKANKFIKTQFEQISFETKQQLNILLNSPIVFELYNRWDRFFVFLLLSNKKSNEIVNFYNSLKHQIEAIELMNSDVIYANKRNELERKLMTDLLENLNISLSMSLGIRNIKVPDINLKNLPQKIRKSNILDHTMVSCPLANYIVNTKDASFHYASFEEYFKTLKKYDIDLRKIKYTPRFIHLREYYIYKSIFYIEKINDSDFLESIKNDYLNIRKIIGADYNGEPLFKCISSKSARNYLINNYNIESKSREKDDYSKINIGLANINIEKTKVLEKGKINFDFLSSDYKYKIYQLLEEVVQFNKEKDNKNIRFLVFPELSIPIEWINELAKYVQSTGVAIICGVKYIKINNRVYNLVATILPITSQGGYMSSIVILREKNDYAPLEKRLIQNQKLKYNQSNIARYDLIDFNNIKFSVFNCYELTDIYARANIRDKIDVLFTIEYNEDIGYFSSIVESVSRDLYSFVVQVNSSNFGDTRIIAPFDDKKKDIAHIKGGELDLVHVGQINLKEFLQYIEYTKSEKYQKDLNNQLSYKSKPKDKFRKYKKLSARTKKGSE